MLYHPFTSCYDLTVEGLIMRARLSITLSGTAGCGTVVSTFHSVTCRSF